MDPLDLLVHGGWKCKKSCLISSRPDGLIFDLGALSHISSGLILVTILVQMKIESAGS